VLAQLAAAGVLVTQRAGRLRVGSHAFNDQTDVDRTLNAGVRGWIDGRNQPIPTLALRRVAEEADDLRQPAAGIDLAELGST
jgi:hypothetical protein